MEFYKFNQSLNNENDLSTEVLINNTENKNFIILEINDLKFGFTTFIFGSIITILILIIEIFINIKSIIFSINNL
jgi:hypothetical protein